MAEASPTPAEYVFGKLGRIPPPHVVGPGQAQTNTKKARFKSLGSKLGQNTMEGFWRAVKMYSQSKRGGGQTVPPGGGGWIEDGR